MGLSLLLGFAGTTSFIPSVEAACLSASERVIKKLERQIRTLKAQLAVARARARATPTPPTPPTPPPVFVEMVKVGNAGNASDSTTTYGAVPYKYSIGKYEVTLAQYAAFLNAVAATDTYNLYNGDMATKPSIAGITQNWSSGSFTYTVTGDGARPVSYVSWFDAARFCNWLHNGQPSGEQDATTTERGAYTLDGARGGVSFERVWAAKYWIPSEDEWYKAAYHQPADQLGDVDDYWLYPTKSNAVPGNTIGSSASQANFITSVYSVTQSASYDSSQNYLTAVGAYSGSAGFYGTFDQGGSVFEWNDAVIDDSRRGLRDWRGVRGGSWGTVEDFLRSSSREDFFSAPDFENDLVGFRVASP